MAFCSSAFYLPYGKRREFMYVKTTSHTHTLHPGPHVQQLNLRPLDHQELDPFNLTKGYNLGYFGYDTLGPARSTWYGQRSVLVQEFW